MKNYIILILTLSLGISATGCSKANVENAPVTVPQEIELSVNESLETSEPLVNETKKNQTNESAQESGSTPASEKKTMFIEIEGNKEEITGLTFHSTLGYQMTYDMDRFQISSSDQMDSFTASNPNPELYPYVYLNVSRFNIPDKTDKNSAVWALVNISDISGYVKKEFTEMDQAPERTSIGDFDAIHYSTTEGTDWNSTVRDYYTVTTDDYIYVFEGQCFLEAQEGYGARISAMLDTFDLD